MLDDLRAHHVQIDVCHAPGQVAVGLHRCCVVSILPKRASSVLARVELLSGTSGDQLHGPGDFPIAVIGAKQMYVIGRSNVVQDRQAIATPGLKKPMPPASPIPDELQEKRLSMAAMGNVPDQAITGDSVCAWQEILNGHSVIEISYLRIDFILFQREYPTNSPTYRGPTPTAPCNA